MTRQLHHFFLQNFIFGMSFCISVFVLHALQLIRDGFILTVCFYYVKFENGKVQCTAGAKQNLQKQKPVATWELI